MTRTVALLVLAIGLSGCAALPGEEPPTPARPTVSAQPSTGATAEEVRRLLGAVRVVARQPDVAGYDRDCGPGDGCVFGTAWTDDTDAPDGHNGCDTRNDVLRASLSEVALKPGTHDCKVVGGTLLDPYTGATMDFATQGSEIHVDHLFPLAAAWDLGAASWTPAQRARFANDTSLELLAVQGTANLQKGESTPASWLPPRVDYRCSYIAAFLAVTDAYDLAITAADVRVIEAVARKSCP